MRLELVLDAEGILLHVGRFRLGSTSAHGVEGIGGVFVGDGQGHLVSGQRDLRQARGNAVRKAGVRGDALQSGVGFRHVLGCEDRLVVHIADGVAAAEGRLAVAENVPGEAEIGGEILERRLYQGRPTEAPAKFRVALESRVWTALPVNIGQQLQRVGLVGHAGQLVAQAQRQGQARGHLPFVLDVEGVIVEQEVADERRAGHIPGSAAGHVQCLAVAVDVAAQRGQQGVGGGQIGAADAGQILAVSAGWPAPMARL